MKSGQSENIPDGSVGDKRIKTMIVPVAAPGCGKTLLGLALCRLYGFGHTQSDDVTTKRTAAGFLKNIETLLKKEVVVYCDRSVGAGQARWPRPTLTISYQQPGTTTYQNITKSSRTSPSHCPTTKSTSDLSLLCGTSIRSRSTRLSA